MLSNFAKKFLKQKIDAFRNNYKKIICKKSISDLNDISNLISKYFRIS